MVLPGRAGAEGATVVVPVFGSSSTPSCSGGTDRIGHVDVEHHARQDGRSGYGLGRLAAFALDMVTGCSTRPLRATTWPGFASALFGPRVLTFVVGRYLLLDGSSVAGFPFLAAATAIFAGARLVALGVIGEHLARMHVRLHGQPTYVIAETVGGADEGPATGAGFPEAVAEGHISGGGPATREAESLLADLHGGTRTVLTTSCTHALELAALLTEPEPGAEPPPPPRGGHGADVRPRPLDAIGARLTAGAAAPR